MFKKCVLVLLCIVGLYTNSNAQLLFAKIEGSLQGEMSSGASSEESIGSLSNQNFEDFITVFGYNDETETPIELSTGNPTSSRIHKPVTFLKPIDKASPLLEQSISKNENLSIEIHFYRTHVSGQFELYFTKKFTNCRLVEVKKIVLNRLDPDNAKFGHLEEISFSFQGVETTHEIAGTSGTDDNQ